MDRRPRTQSIHEAALNNDLPLIRSLLNDGADIDRQDEKDGRTPMQYAAQFNLYEVIAYLAFLGADPQIKTKDGKTASDICRNSTMKDLLKLAIPLTVRTDYRNVIEDSVKLSGNKKMKRTFSQCNVSLRCKKLSTDDTMNIRCRCVRMEQNAADFGIQTEENVCSDVFIFCTNTPENFKKVKIRFPVYCKPSRSEELVVKSNTKQTIAVLNIKTKHTWSFCSIRTDLTAFMSLVAVSRPRKESFTVGMESAIFKSEIEPNLKLAFTSNTLRSPTTIHIQIKDFATIPVSQSLTPGILSSTPCFVFDTDCDKSARTSTFGTDWGDSTIAMLTFPIPTHYTGNGRLEILSIVDGDGRSDENNWEVVDTDISIIQGGCFTFSASLSKVFIGVEIDKSIPRGRNSYITRRFASNIYRSLLLVEFDVIFHIMTKLLDNLSKRHEVVVTCCVENEVKDTVTTWTDKGFAVQSCTEMCKTYAKQPFVITVNKTIQFCNGNKDDILQFHPKRKNVIRFDVLLSANNTIVETNCFGLRKGYTHKGRTLTDFCVEVPLEMKKYIPDALELHSRGQKNQHMAITDLVSDTKQIRTLPKLSMQSNTNGNVFTVEGMHNDIEEIRGDSVTYPSSKHGKEQPSMSNPLTTRSIVLENDVLTTVEKNFLNDNYLRRLLDDIGEAWSIVMILMGISFETIETNLTTFQDEQELQSTRLKLLCQWREDNSNRVDRGVPILLSALRKGGQWALSVSVQRHLKLWHDQPFAAGDPFFTWLERAYRDPDIFIPGDYPLPLSDQFLVMLAPHVQPSVELGSALSLSMEEFSDLRRNQALVNDILAVMKMFTLFRSKKGSDIDKIETLMTTFDRLGYYDAKRIAITTVSGWVKRSSGENGGFQTLLEDLLQRQKNSRDTRSVTLAVVHTRRLSVQSALQVLKKDAANDSKRQT